MSIPRIIHYCWFGGGEKTKEIIKYIEGWKKALPDYEFKEWNESNFSIAEAPDYVKEAYGVKKYAFVSDYARIKALADYGGVYFDTDIEVVRRFDEVLEGRKMVLGFESDKSIETAFIAVEAHHPYIMEFLASYADRHFIKPDGTYDMSVINEHFSSLLESHGLDLTDESFRTLDDGSIAVYPRDYFAAFDIGNWHISPTDNTYTIHHMNASWSNSKKKFYFGTIHFLQKILGYKGYDKMKGLYDKLKHRQ